MRKMAEFTGNVLLSSLDRSKRRESHARVKAAVKYTPDLASHEGDEAATQLSHPLRSGAAAMQMPGGLRGATIMDGLGFL